MAAIAFAVGKAVSFKATMQFLMIVSVLAEIAGRLGLLKDLRLPPLPFLPVGSGSSAAAALRAQARGPATFSFELLNDRYQADMARLGLLTGSGSRLAPSPPPVMLGGRPAAALQPQWPRGLDFVRTRAYGGKTAAAAAAGASSGGNATAAPAAAALGNGTVPAAAAAASHNSSTSSSSTLTGGSGSSGNNGPKPRCYVMTIKGDLYLSQGPYLAQAVSFLLGACLCRLLLARVSHER